MSKATGLAGTMVLVLAGLFFVQFTWLTPSVHSTKNAAFSRKVNLALRRTSHHLLRNADDSTSRIQPVQQSDVHTFSIRLERSFDYDQLPALLQESFRRHGIDTNYDVAILDCARNELQLGYNVRDLIQANEVPCKGRDQVQGCSTLQVTFATADEESQLASTGWTLALGLLLLVGIGYVVNLSRKPPVVSSAGIAEPDLNESRLVRFGRSSLDFTTQTLVSDEHPYSLTYREAKLLRFFLAHPNQVLERDFILKSVWEDEGIIVGRSVDVFVSRLRKLLQNDPTVRIVAVHGVGYRIEIQ